MKFLVISSGGRVRILSCGTVMARSGVDDLHEQLLAEARRYGLAHAAKVLVVADGAVWIWNLAGDRFAQARSAWITITPASICGPWRTPYTQRPRRRRGPRSRPCSRNSRAGARPLC